MIDPVNRPRPWRRYWARMIDTLIGAFVVGVLMYAFVPGTARWFEQQSEFLWRAFAVLAIVPLEALCLSLWGTTPGKRLLGLRVMVRDGSLPDFPKALSRALSVWASGLGFGLPLINLFTMAHAKGVLEREGQTTWDANQNTRVCCLLDAPELRSGSAIALEGRVPGETRLREAAAQAIPEEDRRCAVCTTDLTKADAYISGEQVLCQQCYEANVPSWSRSESHLRPAPDAS